MNAMTSVLDPRAVRLLKEMGIDVWRPRRSEPSVRAAAAPRLDASRAAPAPAAAPAAATVPEPQVAPTRPVPSDPPVLPFTVLCLSKAGAVLLIETADPRAARRFAADLLAAATGAWGGETRLLAFEWPQPGIAPAADAVTRALGAFVGKQLADNDGALVLVGAEVLARLDSGILPDGCLVLPPFDALMTDGSLKRTLWQNVGLRRSQ